jgi:hypothetical protein
MPLDVPRTLRASKLRFGSLRATGIPAILLGAATVVVAAGLARSLTALAPMLPEALRETKSLVEAARSDGRSLKA